MVMASELHSVMPSAAYSLDKPVNGAQPQVNTGSAQGAESGLSIVAGSPAAGRSEAGGQGQSQQEKAPEDLNKMVESLNQNLQVLRRDLQFSVDDTSGQTVVKVLDAETEEVIRQIPSEEVLDLQKRLEEAAGVIFRGKA